MPRRILTPRRRMNWVADAGLGYTTVAAGAQTDFELYDAGDSGREESNYVSPTLVRIRGWVGADPQFSGTGTASDFAVAACAIVHLRGNQTLDLEGASGNWSNDGILWTGLFTFAQNVITVGTPSNFRTVAPQMTKELLVDTSSQRKLGDDSRIVLSMVVGQESNVSVSFVNILRLLIKE